MNYEWYDLLGNIGVFVILICYFLLHIKKLQVSDLSYSVLNALGALLILLSLIYEFNMSAFLMELCWLLISIGGIIISFKPQHSKRSKSVQTIKGTYP
mgnify:CR=1 FL=1